VSPDGKYWYVVFLNHNIMQKFRCADDNWVADIPLTPLAAGTGTANALDWNTFVISSDSRRAYCVSWTASGSVSRLDLENNKLIAMQSGLYFPHGIALNKTENALYVASQTGNFITETDTAFSDFNAIVLENASQNYGSSLDPHDMALSPQGNQLLLSCQKSNEVRVLDLQTRQVVKVIPTGLYPQEIIYSPKFHNYYVSCSGDGTAANTGSVMVISDGDFSARTLKCGAQPHGIAADENNNLLYVLSRNVSPNGLLPHHTSICNGRNGFVNFVDLRNFTITKRKYELSVDPYFIFARP
jgi:YVTN family beta-propeller protein